MPESTGIKGPTAHTAIGTDLSDGNTWVGANSSIGQRVYGVGWGSSNAYAHNASSGGTDGDWFYGYDFGIPTDGGATILGIEVVAGTDFDGSGNSYIGAFGSSSGNGEIHCYVGNGKYFQVLEWDSSTSYTGITLANSNTTARFAGSNKRYMNTTSGDDVLFGAADELHGIAWDPENQANWRFGITFEGTSGTFVAGYLRGVGLRVTYDYTAPPPPPPPPSWDNTISSIHAEGEIHIETGNVSLQ